MLTALGAVAAGQWGVANRTWLSVGERILPRTEPGPSSARGCWHRRPGRAGRIDHEFCFAGSHPSTGPRPRYQLGPVSTYYGCAHGPLWAVARGPRSATVTCQYLLGRGAVRLQYGARTIRSGRHVTARCLTRKM